MENTQTTPSARERLAALLLNESPEGNFADDEALYERVIDDYADYARLLADEHERADRESAQQDNLRSNIEESMLAVEQLKAEGAYGDETIDKALEMFKQMGAAASQGRYSAEDIVGMIKMLNYDADVAQADAAGELRGRNAEIERRMSAPAPVTDGLPHLGSGGTSPGMRGTSIFDLANEA